MIQQNLRPQTVPGLYGIARLLPEAACPSWHSGLRFSAMVRFDDELTLICLQDRIPPNVQAARDWICLRTIGPFPLEAAGIVSSLIALLSENGLGVFVVCTIDGDHLLLQSKDEAAARKHIEKAGHNWT